jgi:GPI ethanolamine phosphate transferase 1
MSCFTTGIFTLLPVEKGESLPLVWAGGALVLVLGAAGAWMVSTLGQGELVSKMARKTAGASLNFSRPTRSIHLVQLGLVVLTMLVVGDTARHLSLKHGLPLLNQWASWALVLGGVFLPYLDEHSGGRHFARTLLLIFLAFSPLFILLSISYEVLFYACFSFLLVCWILLERALHLHAVAGVVASDLLQVCTRGRCQFLFGDSSTHLPLNRRVCGSYYPSASAH